MNKRKKFPGGLKVLLSLLFIMLLGMCSTCYATVDYNDFEIPIEFFDNLILYINSNVSNCPLGASTSITGTAVKDYYNNNIKSNLKTQFENINADERNIIIFIRNTLNHSSASSRKLYICFLYSNNSVNNIENMRTIDTATSRVPSTYTSFQIAYKYQPLAFYQIIINTNNEISHDYSANPGDTLLNWRYEQNNVNLDNNHLNNAPFFGVNQAPLNIINATLPINNTATNYFINGYYNINPITQEPDNPSGDTSGDVPINPSGDNGESGFIDYTNQLNNIKDTISGEGQAIRDTISGENQKIITAIENANESYWGSGESLTGEEQEEQIEENINTIIETISGDLEQIEVIQILEEAEKGFTDIFKNVENSPPEAFDLKFSWNDIKYNGVTIIEKGELNISKMVRDNETLGMLHQYIQIIASFVVFINILKTIYNMIMGALGIIQPEIKMEYETPIADKEIDSAKDGYMIDGTFHM